ncbi:hypothetical protein [Corallococcus sp. EGB]|uniref:hypothetical protein n=1 Tax=Corallococcus sp. EGB TaxID=1521117 RepID=UPI001CC10886|nr:hypothetical protein [Corallococcus sp. EGB]
MLHSGDDVGQGTQPTAVAGKAGRAWSSEVVLQAAWDCACDGCYEPQLVGQSWFTL